MPWVTVGPPSRASALPIATTWSPTATSPVANVAGDDPGGVVELEDGDVVGESTAEDLAERCSPLTVTVTSSASATTWALVRMWPSVSRTMPVPAPSAYPERPLLLDHARRDRDRRGLDGGDDAGDIDEAGRAVTPGDGAASAGAGDGRVVAGRPTGDEARPGTGGDGDEGRARRPPPVRVVRRRRRAMALARRRPGASRGGGADGPGNGAGGRWGALPGGRTSRRAGAPGGGDVGGASGCRGWAPGSRGSNMAPGWVAAARRGREQGENRVRLGRSMQEAGAPVTGPAAAVGSPA